MSKNKFYVTTPIYYVNWIPHIGHFYSSVIASILARYNKVSWKQTRFTTWVDENSQKAVKIAEERKMDIMEYLDEMSVSHKKVWDFFSFPYTDFIRTTEKRHHNLVKEVLQKVYDRWDIYEWVYKGMYCVWCEAFKKDDDLIDLDWVKVCSDHLTEPDKINEKNYFFKLSRYQKWLEEFYEANPDFVMPDFRFNEVREFVKRWLEDFSISRETNKFWVKLPFDDQQVAYVWFDALYNYYTSCKYSRAWDKDSENFIDETDFWPADLHVVWKDIIRFHAIYWPAMLASYFDLWEEKDGVLHYKKTDKERLPKNILTTWFFTIDWQKISKSLWNVIEPVDYSKKYSKDLLTLYILSAFPIWNDGDFDRKDAILTYNAKLANNLWNLVNRVVVLSLKLKDESWKLYWDINQDWFYEKNISWILNKYTEAIKNYDLKSSLDYCFILTDILNKFADEKQPWISVKNDTEWTRWVLYTLADSLRQVWLCLYPFFPEKMTEMFEKLWLENYKEILESGGMKTLQDKKEIYNIKDKWEPLFKRLDT